MKTVILILTTLVLTRVAASAGGSSVRIGDTAVLTETDVSYTGILVKSNELAPCNAKNNKDDLKFDPDKDKLVPAPRPCPNLPKVIPTSWVNYYLLHLVDWSTASTAVPNAP